MQFTQLEAVTGLKYDDRLKIMYGKYHNYKVVIYMYPAPYRITFAVTNGGVLNNQIFKDLNKKIVAFNGCQYYRLTVSAKSALKASKAEEYLINALDYMTDYLSEKGFVNCSEMDGNPCETGVYYAAGAVRLLSQADYERLSRNVKQLAEQDEATNENVPMGIVGAILGSLVGVAAIVLLDRIGFVAAIGGTIMAYCAVFGYEKLGHKLSSKSRWIILAVMVVMVLFANHLCWGISLYNALKERYIVTFTQVLDLLGELLSENNLWGRYFLNLGMIMLFTGLGAIPLLNRSVNSVIESKTAYVIEAAPLVEFEQPLY